MNRKSLTRVLLAGSTAALALGILAMDPAQATSNSSVQIFLQGVVAQSCSLSVNPTNTAANLVLAPSLTETSVNVGSVTETCNDGAGYKVTVSSAMNSNQSGSGNFVGKLKGAASGNNTAINYNVAYGLNSPGTTVPASGVAASYSSMQSGPVTNTVFLTYTPPSSLPADTYSDTLTLTVSTN